MKATRCKDGKAVEIPDWSEPVEGAEWYDLDAEAQYEAYALDCEAQQESEIWAENAWLRDAEQGTWEDQLDLDYHDYLFPNGYCL